MNKKIIASLLIFPLLTSCSGFPVSREDALLIIKNIEADLSYTGGISYTSTSIRTTSDSEEKTISLYDKEKQYFHTYTITTTGQGNDQTGRVSESWKFVMPYTSKTASGEDITKDYIFDIDRKILPSTVDEDIEKQYTVTYEIYSEESWSKAAKEYEDRLTRRFSDALEHSRLLINNENNDVELKSFNEYSLYVHFKENDQSQTLSNNEYELNVSNAQLISIKTVSGETKVETKFEYESSEISYPSFKVTIV